MKFLCDQMLIRLGRWLRAAGYDTEIVSSSISDREVLAQSQKENRLLITRDRHFAEISKQNPFVIWLKSNLLEDCVYELSTRVEINWTFALFSRCLLCNQILDKATKDNYQEVPTDIILGGREIWYCKVCHKAYWEGSHTKRMLKKLQSWQQS